MDLLTLRSGLETLLASDLGTYLLGNNAETPALSVRTPGQGRPPYKSVQGLEVVIENIPAATPIRQYDDQELFRTWTVYLIAWDGSDPTAASAKIVSSYPGTTSAVLQVPPELGPPRQVRLSIPANVTYTVTNTPQ
jgi:hypothetical protein